MKSIDELYPCFNKIPDKNKPHDKHWCLVGQICDKYNLIKSHITIKTRQDETVLIRFYSSMIYEIEGDIDNPSTFKWADCAEGNTVTLLYAKKHMTMDDSMMICLENVNYVSIFPVTQELWINEAIKSNNPVNCFECNSTSSQLLRCTQCKIACYCNKNCQTKHWKNIHKKICGQMNTIRNLTAFLTMGINMRTDFRFLSIAKITDLNEETMIRYSSFSTITEDTLSNQTIENTFHNQQIPSSNQEEPSIVNRIEKLTLKEKPKPKRPVSSSTAYSGYSSNSKSSKSSGRRTPRSRQATMATALESENKYRLWHNRLGHMSKEHLIAIVKDKLVDGIDLTMEDIELGCVDFACSVCDAVVCEGDVGNQFATVFNFVS
eukprot:gene12714-17051_t